MRQSEFLRQMNAGAEGNYEWVPAFYYDTITVHSGMNYYFELFTSNAYAPGKTNWPETGVLPEGTAAVFTDISIRGMHRGMDRASWLRYRIGAKEYFRCPLIYLLESGSQSVSIGEPEVGVMWKTPICLEINLVLWDWTGKPSHYDTERKIVFGLHGIKSRPLA